MEVTIAEERLKEVLKMAVVEVLEERSDLLREIVRRLWKTSRWLAR